MLEFHRSSGVVAVAEVNLPVDAVVAPIATLFIAPVCAGAIVNEPVPVGLIVIVWFAVVALMLPIIEVVVPLVPTIKVPVGLMVTDPVGLIATLPVGLITALVVTESVLNLPAAAVVTPMLTLSNVPVVVGLKLKLFNVRFKNFIYSLSV